MSTNYPSSSATASASKKSYITVNRILCVVYTVVGTCLIPYSFPTNPITVQLILSTLWLGFILSISGMEAWLKFRAPFCPRPFALDIGRTIFPALNSVELGLCISLWRSQQRVQQQQQRLSTSLLVLTMVLILDMVWLTPKLVHRGKQVVYQHVKTHGGAKVDTTSQQFVTLEEELKGIPFAKQDKGHIVYVMLELVKMICLFVFMKSVGP